jgi:glucose/arabinose dehydrogenase
MREFIRPAATALSIACLAASIAAISTTDALAQARQQMAPAPKQQMAPPPQAAPQQAPQIKQMALTEKQIQGVLAASKDMDAITAMLQEGQQPDARMMAQMDAVAKKNGFASGDQYNDVTDNIGLVMGGIDSQTKKYVGNEAVTKAQIAEIQADKKMSPKDKKEALDDLNGSLKSPAPAIQNKGNIDLVLKYYDQLAASMSNGQQ